MEKKDNKVGIFWKRTLSLIIFLGTLGILSCKIYAVLPSCGNPVPCQFDVVCERFGDVCLGTIQFPAWAPPTCGGAGTHTPDPNNEECAERRVYVPILQCVWPIGRCGGVKAWPDPNCG